MLVVACKLDIAVVIAIIVATTTGIHPVAIMMLVAILNKGRDRVEDVAKNRNGRGFVSISYLSHDHQYTIIGMLPPLLVQPPHCISGSGASTIR